MCSSDLPGVRFDGDNDWIRVSSFPYDQPVSYYFVVKPLSWTHQDTIMDGQNNTQLILQYNDSPKVAMYAGIVTGTWTELAVGDYAILLGIFNTTASVIRFNDVVYTGISAGTIDPEGFTVGARGGSSTPSNIEICEIIVYNSAHDSDTQDQVFAYLNAKYSIY